METFSSEIRPGFSDPECGSLIASRGAIGRNSGFELHFNRNEELFIRLPRPFRVPSLPVHHDVREPMPEGDYLRGLRSLLSQLLESIPAAFSGLTPSFDPSDALRPGFFRLHTIEDSLYLYVLRLDLGFRPQDAKPLRSGSNDRTAEYESRDLYVDSEFIPLDSMAEDGRSFAVREMLSRTWVGETGKGYMVRGIWMDADISKFLTRLVLPEGKSVYPYYPLFCKHKTICHQCLRFDAEGRQSALPLFHRQALFLRPLMPLVQKALKKTPFSEKMPEFAEIRKRVPEAWLDAYSGVRVAAYLNDADMKEYSIGY